jgi:amidohydrolase
MSNDIPFEKITSLIRKILPEITEFRHELHRFPEAGHAEFETREKLLEKLKHTSIKFSEPLLKTDLIGNLDVGSSITVGLRADIDALPMRETGTHCAYISENKGYMHACGHDGHMAMLTATALILDSLKDELPCNIRFIFQPAEEMKCGGKDLVSKGACEGLDGVFALHGFAGLPVGAVLTKAGAIFAANGMFKITVQGKGCHGAMPEKGLNPIPAAGEIISHFARLHEEFSQKEGAVISVCHCKSGDCSNIIPGSAFIEGTYRYLDNAVGEEIKIAMQNAVDAVAAETGTEIKFECVSKYDIPVINTERAFGLIKKLALEYFPEDHWRELPECLRISEDFAFYLPGREGAMFLLGLGENSPELHSPDFDFNDEAMEWGILMFCLLAFAFRG